MNSKNSLRHNLQSFLYLKELGLFYILLLVTFTIAGVIGYFTPLYTKTLFETFSGFHVLIFLFLAEYINRLFYQFSAQKLIQKLMQIVRDRLYSRWLQNKLKMDKRSDFTLGEILARIMNDTESLRELISSGSFGILFDLVFVASSLISFLQINSRLGLQFVLIECCFAFLLLLGAKKMAQVYMEVRKSTSVLTRSLSDLTQGMKELHFSPHNNYAVKRGEKVFDDFLKYQLKANVWDASYYSSAESLYPLMVALLIVLIPSNLVIEVALLATLMDLVQKSIGPLKESASKMSAFSRAATGLDRLQEFEGFFTDTAPVLHHELHIDNFTFKLPQFSYPKSSFQLTSIEISAKKGDLIGLVGLSGCGKSTIFKILSGDVSSSAEIICNDNNKILLNEEKANLFYKEVSLVSQDSYLFSGTLAFNISLEVELTQSLKDFWLMAKKEIPYIEMWGVSLDDEINKSKISLGQKQLICALRACYLKKSIILFDEITSSLDPNLEIALRTLVVLLQKNAITFIITHRLETLRNAKRLYVLESGSVVSSGTFADLEKLPLWDRIKKEIS